VTHGDGAGAVYAALALYKWLCLFYLLRWNWCVQLWTDGWRERSRFAGRHAGIRQQRMQRSKVSDELHRILHQRHVWSLDQYVDVSCLLCIIINRPIITIMSFISRWSRLSSRCTASISNMEKKRQQADCTAQQDRWQKTHGLRGSWPLQPVARIPGGQRLRSSSTSALDVPSTRLSTVGDRAFPVAAARTWNSLPAEVTSSKSLQTFKTKLKSHLFLASFP